MPRLIKTETREGDKVNSPDNFLTRSSGGGGAIVHRYSFFAVNALLRCDDGLKVRHLMGKCIFHSHCSGVIPYKNLRHKQGLADKPNSVIRRKAEQQSFIWAMHYCTARATYPFRLPKELSGHLSLRKNGERKLRGLALSGVCRADVITNDAVRSYIKED